MPVLTDSGAIIGWLSAEDALHDRATRLFRRLTTGRDGDLILPDVVFIETLNFLRARVRRPRLAERLADVFFDRHPGAKGWRSLFTTPAVLAEAHDIHMRLYERGLSMTDCVLIVHAQNLNAKVATFDQAFEGIVPTVEA